MVRPTLDGEDGCGFDNFFLTLVRSTDRPGPRRHKFVSVYCNFGWR